MESHYSVTYKMTIDQDISFSHKGTNNDGRWDC